MYYSPGICPDGYTYNSKGERRQNKSVSRFLNSLTVTFRGNSINYILNFHNWSCLLSQVRATNFLLHSTLILANYSANFDLFLITVATLMAPSLAVHSLNQIISVTSWWYQTPQPRLLQSRIGAGLVGMHTYTRPSSPLRGSLQTWRLQHTGVVL